ncbi:MAG TPA: EndoU domain-containing protein [Thermoanaerobaculia bacterium]|nr:EndoU domain-containing protein [Thermoanaerobaculia bacterium]
MKRAVLSLMGLLLGLAIYYFAPGMVEDHQAEAPAPQRAEAPRPVPQQADEEWSDTEPAINLAHVFEGGINRRGKPVGFHSRPEGTNPAGARVTRRVSGPNALGVYIAEVEIRNGSNRWLKKTSTFYPDSLSRDEVVAAILHAWEERRDLGGGKFQGPSGEGFTIEGYTLDDGGINTAYPLYKR